RATSAIVELMTTPQNARDRWMPDAAAIAGVRQGTDVAVALLRYQPHERLAQDTAYMAGIARTVQLMAHHFAMKQDVGALVTLLEAVPGANTRIAAGVLTGIAGGPADEQGRQRGGPGGWPEGTPAELTAAQRTSLANVARRIPAE